MMIGSSAYAPGRFQPERGFEHNWHVWCADGALRVLRSDDFRAWLAGPKAECYTINFGNNASAKIRPGDRLWQTLADIARDNVVEIFPLSLHAKYQLWTGEPEDIGSFDCIKISRRQS